MKNIFEKKNYIALVRDISSIKVFGEDKRDRMPLFTIAIPTFKRVITLSDAIESALNQDDYEDYCIIVVDNNPERGDETEKFMQKYKGNPYITYYKNSINVGMAGNWNKCALLSQSDYFILLHDDDILSPYALSSFSMIIGSLDGEWSLIKPQLKRFSCIKDIVFTKPHNAFLRSLSLLDFSTSCAVGAPTCILYKKASFIEVGGCDSDVYPCIDYVNNINLSLYKKAFRTDSVLGGYRIGENESLSETVMDKYFLNNYLINIQVLKRCYLPHFIIKIVLSAFFDYRVEYEKKYYNMEGYVVNKKGISLYKLSLKQQRFVRFLWGRIVALYDKIYSKRMNIRIN